MTGTVRVRLFKGTAMPVGRRSPNSLYSLSIGSFTMRADYNQQDALGFINLIGLPIKIRALMRQGGSA